jgi:hypothetical protein
MHLFLYRQGEEDLLLVREDDRLCREPLASGARTNSRLSPFDIRGRWANS